MDIKRWLVIAGALLTLGAAAPAMAHEDYDDGYRYGVTVYPPRFGVQFGDGYYYRDGYYRHGYYYRPVYRGWGPYHHHAWGRRHWHRRYW